MTLAELHPGLTLQEMLDAIKKAVSEIDGVTGVRVYSGIYAELSETKCIVVKGIYGGEEFWVRSIISQVMLDEPILAGLAEYYARAIVKAINDLISKKERENTCTNQ